MVYPLYDIDFSGDVSHGVILLLLIILIVLAVFRAWRP